MTLKGLKRKVKGFANGGYHLAEKIITEYHTGEVKTTYRGYTDILGYTKECETPEEVIPELKRMLEVK